MALDEPCAKSSHSSVPVVGKIVLDNLVTVGGYVWDGCGGGCWCDRREIILDDGNLFSEKENDRAQAQARCEIDGSQAPKRGDRVGFFG